mgnify:CR=1 FL=1
MRPGRPDQACRSADPDQNTGMLAEAAQEAGGFRVVNRQRHGCGRGRSPRRATGAITLRSTVGG